MMECDQAKTEIIAYLKGELSAAKREKLEMHLASCPKCRQELEEGRRLLEWTEAASDATIIRAVDDLIDKAIEANASDIHLESQNDDSLRVRYRIDGVMQEVHRFVPAERKGVIARIKMMADLDVGETRVPQDGRFQMRRHERDYDVFLNVTPFVFGQSIVMKVLDKAYTLFGLEKIHLYDDQLQQIERMLTQPTGMIVISGPTGSGKTTTAYSMLLRLNREQTKIVTVEDPVEIAIPGINQAHVNVRAGYTFTTALKSFMRHDPDIIYVGAIRYKEDAELIAAAAITGHMVLCTLHTTNATSVPQRLIDVGVEPFLLGSCLIGAIGQRLVRTICPKCKREAEVDAADVPIQYLGITPDELATHTFYRGDGCEHCHNTGYKGRAAIYEVLTIDKELGSLISKGASSAELLEVAQAKGFLTMREDAKRKVLDGLTTPEEAFRVLL